MNGNSCGEVGKGGGLPSVPVMVMLGVLVVELLLALILSSEGFSLNGFSKDFVGWVALISPMIASFSDEPGVSFYLAVSTVTVWVKTGIAIVWLYACCSELDYSSLVVSPLSRRRAGVVDFVTERAESGSGERGVLMTLLMSLFVWGLAVVGYYYLFVSLGDTGATQTIFEKKRLASISGGGFSMWFERSALGVVAAVIFAMALASVADYFRFIGRLVFKGGEK